MLPIINKTHKSNKNSSKKYEVWGFNKRGNGQYFGYYTAEDFEKTSTEFKIAYDEYCKFFFDENNKNEDGPSNEYVAVAKKLSKLEKKEGIKRHGSNCDIKEETTYTLDELFNL